MLFCSEFNSAGYFEIDEPMRLCKKYYPSARYMLILFVTWQRKQTNPILYFFFKSVFLFTVYFIYILIICFASSHIKPS